MFWILVGAVTVALVVIGLKDADEVETSAVVWGVAALFLCVMLALFIIS